jgi:hypothetical protein
VSAFFLQDVRLRGAPKRPELEVDERPVVVHHVHDLRLPRRERDTGHISPMRGKAPPQSAKGEIQYRFPPRDLFVVPDTGDVGVSSCARGYERRLSDGQCARDARALLVVF